MRLQADDRATTNLVSVSAPNSGHSSKRRNVEARLYLSTLPSGSIQRCRDAHGPLEHLERIWVTRAYRSVRGCLCRRIEQDETNARLFVGRSAADHGPGSGSPDRLRAHVQMLTPPPQDKTKSARSPPQYLSRSPQCSPHDTIAPSTASDSPYVRNRTLLSGRSPIVGTSGHGMMKVRSYPAWLALLLGCRQRSVRAAQVAFLGDELAGPHSPSRRAPTVPRPPHTTASAAA